MKKEQNLNNAETQALNVPDVSHYGSYEYFVENKNGEMEKVADSYSLIDNGINEQDYQKGFEYAERTCQIKGYISHCG